MEYQYFTNSALETKEVGRSLAKKLLKIEDRKRAIVLALKGDLGGGKTTFVQGFADGLGIKQRILSPTFTIIKGYRLRLKNYKLFYHIDCYRIKKSKELIDLGLMEIVENQKDIIAIEWAEKTRRVIPKDAIWIKFEFIKENTRKIILEAPKLILTRISLSNKREIVL